jgi:predicted nucleic acid-binding protein
VISGRVVNASPRIYLTQIGLLEVLDEPGVPVVVPDRVLAEIGAQSQAILDDLDAHHCAASLGISTQGTLGLMLVAKGLGLIAEVRPLIDRLRQAGFSISRKLAEQVPRAAGE